MSLKRHALGVAGGCYLAATVGCGGPGHPNRDKQVQLESQYKVELTKKLAEAVEKGDNTAALGHLEGFRSTSFDPAASSAEAAEIVQIYKTQIQPKAKGELAAEIDMEFKPLLGSK